MKIGYDILIDDKSYKGFFDGSLQAILDKNLGEISATLLTEYDKSTGVSRRRLAVKNQTESAMCLHHADIVYELAYPCAHLDYFTSDWGSEYSPVSLDVTYPARIGTWSGRSSKGCSPFFSVRSVAHDCGFFGVSVGWSGNWEATVERGDDCNTVNVGLLKDDFFKILQAGECFENIEIFDATCQEDDIEALSIKFRTFFRDNISLMKDVFADLPVCYNSWWPYEDKWINEEVFYKDAKVAKELGFTNTLLDAGWFGPANDPTEPGASGWYNKQGDWDLINTRLFPSGMAALGNKINNDAGIPFGIWCEIEAVGKDSHLFETAPDMIAMKDGKPLNYVCMGNLKTREWAKGVFKRLIEEYGAKWIKIDFNLDPVSCDCEEHGHGKGDGLYEHYKGLYQFMDEIRAAYPHVVLEDCSSGGLRIDYGILQHCHLAFLSDPDYTPHHLKCFWGALSHIHPCGCYHFTKSETVCEHNFAWTKDGERFNELKPVTEETSMTRFDYMTRAAMMSSVGFSLKLSTLPKKFTDRIKEHVKMFRKISLDYLYNGDAYRLSSQPLAQLCDGPRWSAFEFVSSDLDAVVFAFKKPGGDMEAGFKLKGLLADEKYLVKAFEETSGIEYTGEELMKNGICFKAAEDEWSQVYSVTKA